MNSSRAIHHPAFNANRDIRTDTKEILRVGVHGLIISPRQRRWRKKRDKEREKIIALFITEATTVSVGLRLLVRHNSQTELFHYH